MYFSEYLPIFSVWFHEAPPPVPLPLSSSPFLLFSHPLLSVLSSYTSSVSPSPHPSPLLLPLLSLVVPGRWSPFRLQVSWTALSLTEWTLCWLLGDFKAPTGFDMVTRPSLSHRRPPFLLHHPLKEEEGVPRSAHECCLLQDEHLMNDLFS